MPLLNTEPRIEQLNNHRLVGLHQAMSLADNRTVALWQSFMPRLKEFTCRMGSDLYSLQQYPLDYFRSFDPTRTFEKWAAAAVFSADQIPAEMDTLLLNGTYAVFEFQGTPGEFGNAIQHIVSDWLPQSVYELDDRPHFELLGEKYNRNDPHSEEEIWIPVRLLSL